MGPSVEARRGPLSCRHHLLVGVIVAAAVVVLGLFSLVNRPIGSQVDMDEDLDESYCQMLPEDCR